MEDSYLDSTEYEDKVQMESEEVKPRISTRDLVELRQRLKQMKDEESCEEMQHQLHMEELKLTSKGKEHQYTQEVNDIMTKKEEMRRQRQEDDKIRADRLKIEDEMHETSMNEIRSQLKEVEEEFDLKQSSIHEILNQRQLEAEMAAMLHEKDLGEIQKDFEDKENSLKEMAVNESNRHKESITEIKANLADKYRKLEEQLWKEQEEKMETAERDHRKTIERLNAQVD